MSYDEYDEIDEADPERPGQTKADHYRQLAQAAMRELLEAEHAAVWHEIEAKLSERPHPGAGRGINPHHLTTARRLLMEAGVIDENPAPTRGGRVVSVLGLADRQVRRRLHAFETAAQRKRLLQARYLGWAEGGGRGAHVIGDAGELVARDSLRAAAAAGVGYRLVKPEGGDIEELWGRPVPGGSLDDAAELIAGQGRNRAVVTIAVDLRKCLYPDAAEIHQLLYKAAMLQLAEPDERIVPVLICRWVHKMVYWAAKHLGFFVIEFSQRAQPILEHHTVDPKARAEVQRELGYVFAPIALPRPGELRSQTAVTGLLSKALPENALAISDRWSTMAPALAPVLDRLREDRLEGFDRQVQMDKLYRSALAIQQPPRRWRRV